MMTGKAPTNSSRDGHGTQQEIIEFSAVMVSTETHEVGDTFQAYVKPTVHPVLTPFCQELTGIHQEWVDNGAKSHYTSLSRFMGQFPDAFHPRLGVSLGECLDMFNEWLDRHDLLARTDHTADTAKQPTFWLVTWSDWDLGVMLEEQCSRTGLSKAAHFNQWMDVKQIYMLYYRKKFRY